MQVPSTTQSQTIAVAPAAPNSLVQTATQYGGGLFHALQGGNGLMLLLAAVGWGALTWFGRDKKNNNKIASGYLSGDREKRAARKRSIEQLEQRKHNAVTLYAGLFERNKKGQPPNSKKTLWIPDANRGIAVCGGPGSGKTFSLINPAIRSAIKEGMPLCLYDFKYPEQAELLVPYAAKHGYDVKIFAPGFEESEVCNPLDFLRSPDDALMARQIATVMNRNFALSSNASEDKFFADAGDQLTQAMLMLAKGLPAPDILTASTILSLSKLPERIQAAWERSEAGTGYHMSQWVYLAFSQLLQLAGSEKTVSGVVGTASKVFSRFLSPELVGAFCGATTLPLDLEGKRMIVLGLDRQRRDAVAPLVATILHMLVARNARSGRKDPFLVAVDELPTVYLPTLTQWLNENRSLGQVTLIGYQNLNQLEKAYSREISRAILGGCATKAIFNPQESESARMFSDYIGEEELMTKQKSRSTGKGGGSTSTGEHLHKRAIVESAQFNKFVAGKCVFINPAYAANDEGSIPLITKISLPKADIEADQWSRSKWEKVRQRLIKLSKQAFFSEERSREQIARRMAISEEYFPAPEEKPAKGGSRSQENGRVKVTF